MAVFDENGTITDIVEKPQHPPSNLAIGGIYMFDERFWNYLDAASNEQGDTFSISDITRMYVRQGEAGVLSVGEETWVDCGTRIRSYRPRKWPRMGNLTPRLTGNRKG